MKKIYLIVDVTDKDQGDKECRYLGDCKGMTGSLDEADAMLMRVKKSYPGRKIVKKTSTVTEVEICASCEDGDLCSIVPTIRQEAEI